jgi:hypothetical protein
LRRTAINFMCVCTHRTTQLLLDGSSLKSEKNKGYFLCIPIHIFDNISISSCKNEKLFCQICREKSAHISRSITSFFFCFRKSWRLWNYVEKYCTAGQATDGNMAHAHCMLHNYNYKHTLSICSADCFSIATMFAVRASRLPYTYIACVVLLSIDGNTFKIRLSLISHFPHLDKTQLNAGKLIHLLKRSAILMFHLRNLSTVRPLQSYLWHYTTVSPKTAPPSFSAYEDCDEEFPIRLSFPATFNINPRIAMNNRDATLGIDCVLLYFWRYGLGFWCFVDHAL